MIRFSKMWLFLIAVFATNAAFASGASDGLNLSLFGIGLILFIIIFAAFMAGITKLSSVVCELIIGMLLSFIYAKFANIHTLLANPAIVFIAEFGSVLLLLEVGLETKLSHIASVGRSAMIVAIVGVVLPTLSGIYLISPYLFGVHNSTHAIFIGATMAATSVGISVRVFKDLGLINSLSAKVVINAAIVDDVLGLILLSIAISLYSLGNIDLHNLVLILGSVFAYFILAFLFGLRLFPRILAMFSGKFIFNQSHFLLLLLGYSLLLACIAKSVGLASIIGAFVTGVIFSELPTRLQKYKHKINLADINELESSIKPISGVFIPIFFVYAGMQIDLSLFFSVKVIVLGLLVSVIAIITKLLSSIFLGKKYNKLIIGSGMVPRGEVGLIFAISGKTLGIINNQEFTILMFMIMTTSIITPFLLKSVNNYYLGKSA